VRRLEEADLSGTSGFELDLSHIEPKLAAYSPTIRRRALAALESLRERVQAISVYAAPGASWLRSERQDVFRIKFLASASCLTPLDIGIENGPSAGEREGFVVQRNGVIRAFRIHGRGLGPSALLVSDTGITGESVTGTLDLSGPAPITHGTVTATLRPSDQGAAAHIDGDEFDAVTFTDTVRLCGKAAATYADDRFDTGIVDHGTDLRWPIGCADSDGSLSLSKPRPPALCGV
jgi:hypothetical protein